MSETKEANERIPAGDIGLPSNVPGEPEMDAAFKEGMNLPGFWTKGMI